MVADMVVSGLDADEKDRPVKDVGWQSLKVNFRFGRFELVLMIRTASAYGVLRLLKPPFLMYSEYLVGDVSALSQLKDSSHTRRSSSTKTVIARGSKFNWSPCLYVGLNWVGTKTS
jgi:hypothetical protein